MQSLCVRSQERPCRCTEKRMHKPATTGPSRSEWYQRQRIRDLKTRLGGIIAFSAQHSILRYKLYGFHRLLPWDIDELEWCARRIFAQWCIAMYRDLQKEKRVMVGKSREPSRAMLRECRTTHLTKLFAHEGNEPPIEGYRHRQRSSTFLQSVLPLVSAPRRPAVHNHCIRIIKWKRQGVPAGLLVRSPAQCHQTRSQEWWRG